MLKKDDPSKDKSQQVPSKVYHQKGPKSRGSTGSALAARGDSEVDEFDIAEPPEEVKAKRPQTKYRRYAKTPN
jgi:hypothetical protein